MSEQVTNEDLMRYLDGELSPEKRALVEAELENSTELRRELSAFRAMKDELATLQFGRRKSDSVWDTVNRKLARPTGWTFFLVGVVAWTIYGTYLFVTSTVALFEKLATGAIVIGTLILLASVIWERYLEYLTDPYRDIQR